MASDHVNAGHTIDGGIAVTFITGSLGCTVKVDILRLGSQQSACLYLPAVDIDTFFSF
ncbi:Uncharacterised protein [Neisseria meningitidis]|uniref:Uncharacterized protein n=1 Tax=Neisseria meningitidis TaxID=487 RepID=A0AB33TYI8_NEIME|nr:Uncharacterised protein [Neisseria meningitidis]CWM83108.1 Uncharacterised protein [Neisseria meningitidis]CWM84099.1 Uncharacterised protein [Neisseria meningitidis]CWM85978.1 Uncharacterised protein [Neisseria meningitidis]CWN03107.1 Uncharacterised protein [Neisseria meningitidis]